MPTRFFQLAFATVLVFLDCHAAARAQLLTTPTYTSNYIGSYADPTPIAVANDGSARLLVQDFDGSGNPELVYLHCLNPACSSYHTAIFNFPSSDDYILGYSLALGPDGYARIAYQVNSEVTWPDGEMHGVLGLIQCGDDDCATTSINPQIALTAQWGAASVAVANDGTTYIAYDDGNDWDGPEGIALATCTGTSCSTADIVSGLDPDNCLGAAAALGSDGDPVVAYMYGNCGNFSPETVYLYSGGGSTTITSNGPVYTTGILMSTGLDGFARLLFGYNDAPGFQFVQCTDTPCASFATNPLTVPSGAGGTWASVGVAPDGTARVEMDAGAGGNFTGPDYDYYLVCGAADCSTYSTQVISAVAGDSAGVAWLAVGRDGAARMLAQDTNGVNYLAEELVPAKLVYFNTSCAPRGQGPLQIITNGNIVDCLGNIKASNVCGVSRNLTYQLLDQNGDPFTQAYTISESFSNLNTTNQACQSSFKMSPRLPRLKCPLFVF